ncbi:MAG: acyltransferase [Actinobacteria bacterium]|nr:MAG: acyltransferase [Actinomycetota bacterium]
MGMSGRPSSRLDELVAATPSSRDRYVDFLRAASIAGVVFGHWFIAIIFWDQGVIGVHSAIGVTSGLWVGTWLFQVIPIFFFVGGFSNFVAYRAFRERGRSTADFLRTRAVRLLKPTAIFVAAWLGIEVVLHFIDRGGTGLIRGVHFGNTLPFGPMWFLGVYLVVVLLSPITIALHRRFGVWVPLALAGGVVCADVVGLDGGLEGVRNVNVLLAWSLAHQLGYFYADGSLTSLPRRAHVAMAGLGLAALIVLTNVGVYPRSMLGTDATFFHLKPIEQTSNMNPPTVCIVALTLWLIGLAMVLRPSASRWLERLGPWKATIVTNSVIMTLFLWHMTAYAGAILILHPLGLGTATDSTARWWMERPVWEFVPGVILLGIVLVVGRFERARRG